MSQIQFYDGVILFVDGAIAMHEDCCCKVCEEIGANRTQPDAAATVAGACGHPDPCDGAGAYEFLQYSGPPDTGPPPPEDCWWTWQKVVGDRIWYLYLFYCPTAAGGPAYCAKLIGPTNYAFGDGTNNCPCEPFLTDVTAHITVVDGVLTGVFDLVGDANCAGCTATVTVGA